MGVTYVLLLLSTLWLAIHTQAQDCSAPVPGANMQLKDDASNLQTFPDGTKVSFACDIGYVSAGGSPSITCTNGNWSLVNLRCEKRNCGPAGEVANGYIDYPEGTEFGSKAEVICNAGYNIVGKPQVFCGANGWQGRLAECEVVTCYPPSSVENGAFGPLKETYDFLEVVQYTCLKGYTLSGIKSLSCSEDGTFKPAPPTCVAMVECKDPDIKYASMVGSRPPHKYMATLTLKCDSGYTMMGVGTQTCGIDGQWSPGLPTCQPVQCEDPKVKNADRVGEPPFNHMSKVTFKCYSKYTMKGADTQTCGPDGQWSPGLPTCQLTQTTTRPTTTKGTIVDPVPTDPPGNNGNNVGLGIGLTVLIGSILTACGCYFCGVPALVKKRRNRRARRGSPDNVVPNEEGMALSRNSPVGPTLLAVKTQDEEEEEKEKEKEKEKEETTTTPP